MKIRYKYMFEKLRFFKTKYNFFKIYRKQITQKNIVDNSELEGEMSEGVRKILKENYASNLENKEDNIIEKKNYNVNSDKENVILNMNNLITFIEKFKFNNDYENFYLSHIKQFHKHLPLILLFLEYYCTYLINDIKVKSRSHIDYIKKTTNKIEENHHYTTLEESKVNFDENITIFDPSAKNMSHLRSNLKNNIIIYDIVYFVNEELNSSIDPFLLLSFIESIYKLKNLGAFIDLDNKNFSHRKNNILNFFNSNISKDEDSNKKTSQKLNIEFLFNSVVLKIQMYVLNNNFLRKISFSHYYLILNLFSTYFKIQDSTIDSEEIFEKVEYEVILFIKEKYKSSLEEANSKVNIESKMEKKIYSINEYLTNSSILTSIWLFKDNFIEIFLLMAKNLEGSKIFYEYFTHIISSHLKAIFNNSFLIENSILSNRSNDLKSDSSLLAEYFELKLFEEDKKSKVKKKKYIQKRNLLIEIYYSYILISEHVYSCKIFENIMINIESLLEKNIDCIVIYFSNTEYELSNDNNILSDKSPEKEFKNLISNIFIEKRKLNKEILEWSINRREKYNIQNKLKSINL